MEATNAAELKSQIELIESTLKTAETIVFPKKILIAYGVLILLIPAFERVLPPLWWMKVLFYAACFTLVRYVMIRFFGAWKKTASHPILSRSLVALKKFAICSAVLLSFAVNYLGQVSFIFPILLVHVAFVFFSYGKFSSGSLKIASYAQLTLATVYIMLLRDFAPEILLPYFTTLLAMTFFAGAFARET